MFFLATFSSIMWNGKVSCFVFRTGYRLYFYKRGVWVTAPGLPIAKVTDDAYSGNLNFFILIGRLAYVQLIKGEELQNRALDQWTMKITCCT